MKNLRITIILLMFSPLSSYAQTVSLEKIINNPKKYQDKTVSVKGEVVASYEIPFLHFYKIKDEKGDVIHVVSNTDTLVPNEGEIVKIKGKVNRLYKIGKKQLLVIEEENEKD